MPGRSWVRDLATLCGKEWRELRASGAWWALVILTGPLLGFSFIRAVDTYAEISHGAGSACGHVCDPVVGIWAPSFAAFDILTIFLLPLVVIRLVTADHHSGAAKLEWQRPCSPAVRLGAKVLTLAAAALLPSMAAVLAVALWRAYGGHVALAEIATVAAGYALHALLTVSVAAVASAATDHPSTAAVVALGFTVGTWVVDFASTVYGGAWSSIAALTPARLAAPLQRGLIETRSVGPALVWSVGLLAIAALALQPGVRRSRHWRRSAAVLVATALLGVIGAALPGATDVTESRLNSFPRSAEAALARVSGPVEVEVHLAPEDPRRIDLEHHALPKLRRAVPGVHIAFVSRTATGIFEQQDPKYGEIHYRVGARETIGRAVTEDAVLEDIFEAAEVDPDRESDPLFAGYPLEAPPSGAALLFHGVWPALAALLAWRASKQRAPSLAL